MKRPKISVHIHVVKSKGKKKGLIYTWPIKYFSCRLKYGNGKAETLSGNIFTERTKRIPTIKVLRSRSCHD